MLNKRLSKKSKLLRTISAPQNSRHRVLPTKNRMDQCVCVNVMKFFNGTAQAYNAEIFHPANQGRITRRSKFELEFPFRKSTSGQKCLSYLGPKIWNSLPCDLKSANNPNTFKNKIKNNFIPKIQKRKMTHTSSTKTLPRLSQPCFCRANRVLYR